jgi:hypothetical protein
MSAALPAPGPLARLLLWAGVALAVAGLVLEKMGTHWLAVRSEEHLKFSALVLVLAWPFAYWRRVPFAWVLAAVFVVLAGAYIGVLPLLACTLMVAAAFALGDALLPVSLPARGAIAIVAGFAVFAATVGWTLPWPVHRRMVYAVVLLALCAWRRRALHDAVRTLFAGPHATPEAGSWAAGFAVLVAGLASTAAWVPSVQFDDLAFHLGLPFQLQLHGAYRLDPQTNVWALAPWAGDALQGIAQVLAGGEARGAVNLAWLVVSLRLLWSLAEGLGLEARLRWLCLAVFASQPLVACLLGGAQAETATTAVLFAMALVVQRAPADPEAATLRVFALLCGAAIALKMSNVLLAGPCALWLLARWRGRLPWRALPWAFALGVAVGGSSYFYSTWLTGNPVLPLFNGVFHSPFFAPVDFDDARWHAGFDWRLPWRIAFHTDQVFEAWPGGAGFALVALGGATAWALCDRALRPLALVALACLLLPLSQLQYVRYAHPAASLLVPVAIAAARRGAGVRVLAGLLAALAVLNLAFQANSSWILREGALKVLVGHGRAAVLAGFAPERVFAETQRNAADADRRVTFFADPGRPLGSELAGHYLTVSWYDPGLSAAYADAEGDASGRRWRALLARAGATHVVIVPATTSAALRAALADATREQAVRDVELWRLPPQPSPSPSPSLLARRDFARLLWGARDATGPAP